MTSQRQIEANRRNAKKSTGPRTEEGKAQSRLNAVTHGMTAEFDAIPGEEADALKARIDEWIADSRPHNEVERELIERAARASWQLERVEQAQVARLTEIILKATSGKNDEVENEVLNLGQRLFEDLASADGFAPHPLGDSDDPAQIVRRLESSAPGCQWLLDRWAELGTLLQHEQPWQYPDQIKALRLLGLRPLDLLSDSRVAVVFLACHTIDSSGRDAFDQFRNESDPEFLKSIREDLEPLRPQGPAQAKDALSKIIDRAVSGLELKAELRRERDERDAASAPARLAFDTSRKGELLRKYEASCQRAFFRTIDTLMQVRKVGRARRTILDVTAARSSTDADASVEAENTENEPIFPSVEMRNTGSHASAETENAENEPISPSVEMAGSESHASVECGNAENEPISPSVEMPDPESDVSVERENAENEPISGSLESNAREPRARAFIGHGVSFRCRRRYSRLRRIRSPRTRSRQASRSIEGRRRPTAFVNVYRTGTRTTARLFTKNLLINGSRTVTPRRH
jgi:hypothetical protein